MRAEALENQCTVYEQEIDKLHSINTEYVMRSQKLEEQLARYQENLRLRYAREEQCLLMADSHPNMIFGECAFYNRISMFCKLLHRLTWEDDDQVLACRACKTDFGPLRRKV